MAIAFSKYINITSGVGAGVTVAQRELIGRLFTTNALVPTGSYVEFDSAAEVGAYFGTTTEEYKRALYYFSFISKNITTPQKISFASYQPASTAPKIFGAPITSSLSSFTSIANGSLHIQMGSFSTTFSSIDFTGLTSFAQVAAKLTTYIINYTTGGTLWTSAAVTYNSTTASFNLVGGAVGNAVISITPGISADISPLIGWNSPQTIFSNGISAQQPSDALVASTQASTNFGSFLFIPALTLEEITAAAIWNDSQNILYQYMIPILTITDAPTYSTALLPYGGSAMTLSFTSGEYPEMLPMMILAATNYMAMLDPTLFRRFDDVIRYERPGDEQICALIRNRLQRYLVKRPGWHTIRQAAVGLSHAEIARACDDAVKDCILGDTPNISAATLIAVLQERRRVESIRSTNVHSSN